MNNQQNLKTQELAKTSRPRLLKSIVRQRLFNLLDEGSKNSIIWVSGSAGSGKTALISSYIEKNELPSAWYQVDDSDDDPASFFHYFSLACQDILKARDINLASFTKDCIPSINTFTRNYFRQLFIHIEAPSFIIFDNYQELSTNSPIHELFQIAIREIPKNVTIIFISRMEAPENFSLHQIYNDIFHITQENLNLTLQECEELFILNDITIDREHLKSIHAKANGWMAGCMILTKSNNQKSFMEQELSKDTQELMFHYFAREIFIKLEHEVQQFLLKTAMLPHISIKIAISLTGNTNSAYILNWLNQNNYFTLHRPATDTIYQYHPLFRDYLIAQAKYELDEKELLAIQQRTANILLDEAQYDDAIKLLIQIKAWDLLENTILLNADKIYSQGRYLTLQSWLNALPGDSLKSNPWLLYWQARCLIISSPADAVPAFEQAFRLFEISRDINGLFLSWSDIIEAILVNWDNFNRMDPWLKWLDDNLNLIKELSDSEIEIRISTSVIIATTYREPQRKDIEHWISRALSLCVHSHNMNLCLQANVYIALYYTLVGNKTSLRITMDRIRMMADSTNSDPSVMLILKWVEASYYMWFPDNAETPLQCVQEGLEIAESSGIHYWDHMLSAEGVYAALDNELSDIARGFLKQMESILDHNNPHMIGHYHYLMAWYYLVTKDFNTALGHAKMAVENVIQSSSPLPEAICYILLIHTYTENQDFESAQVELSHIQKTLPNLHAPLFEFMYLVAEADLFSRLDNETQFINSLDKLMIFGKKHGYVGAFAWRPPVMSRLCAMALNYNIEPGYVRKMIIQRDLFPDPPPLDVKNWPWAIEVRTLGDFQLKKDNIPIEFHGKAQKKPLEMLQVIITLGGYNIREDKINNLLWPDSDGDNAHISFATTLHRLRKLIGTKAIQVQQSTISINPRMFWVDSWEFERRANHLLQTKTKKGDISSILKLYKGNFLTGENSNWALFYNERLRKLYIDLVNQTADDLSISSEYDHALLLYQDALHIDPLVESFYQGIMNCYLKKGHLSDGLKAYNVCHKVLNTELGIGPSNKTELLKKELLNKANGTA